MSWHLLPRRLLTLLTSNQLSLRMSLNYTTRETIIPLLACKVRTGNFQFASRFFFFFYFFLFCLLATYLTRNLNESNDKWGTDNIAIFVFPLLISERNEFSYRAEVFSLLFCSFNFHEFKLMCLFLFRKNNVLNEM